MTVSLSDIIAANQAFNRILTMEFTSAQAFTIGRILRILNDEVISFNKTRETLLRKYASYDENGNILYENNSIKISAEKQLEFQKEVTELLNVPIEINVKAIPFEWLEDISLTPKECVALEPFVEF